MPSDQNTADDLELDIEADESGDDQEGSDADQTAVEVTLAEAPKLTPAEQNALAQEEKWLQKITAGQASIEDLQNNPALKWLAPRVEKRLGALEQAPTIDEIVEKKLKEKQEEQDFKNLQANLPKLSPAQAEILKERYAELVKSGASRLIALKTAIDLSGIANQKKGAPLPPMGKPKTKMTLDINAIAKDEKLYKEMIKDPEGFAATYGFELESK